MRTFLLLLLFPLLVQAQDFQVPAIHNHVVDEALLIDSHVENEINTALAQVKRDTGVEMAVLTVQSLEGLTVEQASMHVVEKWRLGTVKGDKGLLLLVSKNDRKLRFEVGYGLEGNLTDAEAGRIINNAMVPLLKQGDSNKAILTGVVQAVQQAIPDVDVATYFNNGQKIVHYSTKKEKRKNKFLSTLFTLLMWVIIYFVLGRRGFLGFFLGSSLGRGYSGGSFGSSGSSFGGGGGFGGGGASGGW